MPSPPATAGLTPGPACRSRRARGAFSLPKRSPSHAMRAKLLYKLMDSLDESPASDTEATWVAEVRRPLALYRAGELKAVPMERAIAELRSVSG